MSVAENIIRELSFKFPREYFKEGGVTDDSLCRHTVIFPSIITVFLLILAPFPSHSTTSSSSFSPLCLPSQPLLILIIPQPNTMARSHPSTPQSLQNGSPFLF